MALETSLRLKTLKGRRGLLLANLNRIPSKVLLTASLR